MFVLLSTYYNTQIKIDTFSIQRRNSTKYIKIGFGRFWVMSKTKNVVFWLIAIANISLLIQN